MDTHICIVFEYWTYRCTFVLAHKCQVRNFEIIQFCTVYSHLPSLYLLIILNNQVDQLSPPSHKSTWIQILLYLHTCISLYLLPKDPAWAIWTGWTKEREKKKGSYKNSHQIIFADLAHNYQIECSSTLNTPSNTNTFNLTSHKNIRNSSYLLLNISYVSSTMLSTICYFI